MRRRIPGWLTVVFLIVFWPVGIALTWRTGWSDRAKIAVTIAVVGVIALLLLPFNIGVGVGIGTALRNPSAYSQPAPTARAATQSTSPSATSTPRPITGSVGTTVALSDHDPWTAGIAGFDLDLVQWVTYYVRDAQQHWTSIGPVNTTPFQADLPWWTWDSSGDVVVTSHVHVLDSRGPTTIKDPGGWRHIDGRITNPGGHLEALINSDDSLDLRYIPGHAGAAIGTVQFWLRTNGHWAKVAETSRPAAGQTFEVLSVPGTQSGSWKTDDSAVSVHVVWPGGRRSVDPAPWVWRDHFGQAPLVPLPQSLRVSGAVTGQLTLGINPHRRASDNPSPAGNVPTWTRCAVFSNAFGATTLFEADIVGNVGSRTYTLSIVDQDLGQHRVPGTYSSGDESVVVTFATTDGTARWQQHAASDSVAVVTFTDRASGSINARLGGQQPISVSGTWRCGGTGPVAAAIPQLPEVAKSPAAPPPAASPAPPPPSIGTPPAAATPAPASCYPLSNSGTCYRPGEFCRNSDHGRSGRTADGEAIICEYNNGWRWEPA